mmetsp:Transcript_57758/g.93494  ORF Transcript_57758/g.93494 Transcript_57758/m.93494 type:complete len:222 (-) Transcript_57758:493-1158(-)
MREFTREARPLRRPTRFVSSKRSWIAVAMASMLRHVDTKYCEITSEEELTRPPSPRTGSATRYSPITVTKYLLRYWRTSSELKLRLRVLRTCSSSSVNFLVMTLCAGISPPKNATCSQFVMSSECAARNRPSSRCSSAANCPKGGSVTVDTAEAKANQAYKVRGVVSPCTRESSTEYTRKSTIGLSDCDSTDANVSENLSTSEVIWWSQFSILWSPTLLAL